MDSGDGADGRSGSDDLPSPSSPLPPVVPESDDAHGNKRALERAQPSHPRWVSKISLENSLVVFKALAKAVAVSTTTPEKTVRFAVGVSFGAFLSWLAALILDPLFPFTVPRSFFLLISLSVSMGILFARTRFWDGVFTSAEERLLERAHQRHMMEMNALATHAAQMRGNGLTGREIEEELGPHRARVLAELQKALAAIPIGPEGEKAVMTAIEGNEPKDPPPKPEPRRLDGTKG